MCNLHRWLKQNDYNVKYDAVDIREDALGLCDCDTFTEVPKRRKYDLVCLFGTVTYNIDEDKEGNRQLLKDLLEVAAKSSKKYIVFTVIKSEGVQGLAGLRLVSYTRKEVEALASSLGNYIVIDDVDPEEYIIIVTKD
jgi:hypothetical protein